MCVHVFISFANPHWQKLLRMNFFQFLTIAAERPAKTGLTSTVLLLLNASATCRSTGSTETFARSEFEQVALEVYWLVSRKNTYVVFFYQIWVKGQDFVRMSEILNNTKKINRSILTRKVFKCFYYYKFSFIFFRFG